MPEDLLREAIIAEIPELADGTIAIVDTVTEPGVQSKVVVRHSNAHEKAVPICVGEAGQRVTAINDTLPERVWFVEGDDRRERFLANCLGVRPDRVVSVEINDALRTAKVLVADVETCALAIGTQGVNARQTAQLVGLRFVQVEPQ